MIGWETASTALIRHHPWLRVNRFPLRGNQPPAVAGVAVGVFGLAVTALNQLRNRHTVVARSFSRFRKMKVGLWPLIVGADDVDGGSDCPGAGKARLDTEEKGS